MKRVALGFALGALCAGLFGAGLRKDLLAEVRALRGERDRVVAVAEAATKVGDACTDYARACQYVARELARNLQNDRASEGGG